MEVKVAATCMNWSKQIGLSQCHSSSSRSFASSTSSDRRRPSLVCRFAHRSTLFRTVSEKQQLLRAQSKSRVRTLIRAVNASSDGFSDEDITEEIEELASRFNLVDGIECDSSINSKTDAEFPNFRGIEGESINHTSFSKFDEEISKSINNYVLNPRSFPSSKVIPTESPWLGFQPDWSEMNDIIPASIERKANSVDIPHSLRIIKRKNQWGEGFREAGESAYCSVKKAFSSMVFIIREVHSYTLQMREMLCYEDLQGILARVQNEMHASFVWLFQQIFSHTPTLMMYVMILLANFTVHSMSQNLAIAAPPQTASYSTITEMVSVREHNNQDEQQNQKFETSTGKMTFIGGNKGGGGNFRSVSSSGNGGGDGRFNGFSSFNHHRIIPDEISKVTSFGNPMTEEVDSENHGVVREDEVTVWNSIVEEASIMQGDAILDHETKQHLVSPVKVEVEGDTYSEFFRTELLYRKAISEEPNNPLLLSNYAQFLYLVSHDHDRAEEYFKKATQLEPPDAEALSRYANFLWWERKDIEGAEERYLEAIEADPGNMFHAGCYAHFLWNTGGEDTCFPLGSLNGEA